MRNVTLTRPDQSSVVDVAQQVPICQLAKQELENMDGIASKIRAARVRLSVTQGQLATMLGITRNYVAQIEMGRKIPSLSLLVKISAVIKCEVQDLIRDEPALSKIRVEYGARANEIIAALEDC